MQPSWPCDAVTSCSKTCSASAWAPSFTLNFTTATSWDMAATLVRQPTRRRGDENHAGGAGDRTYGATCERVAGPGRPARRVPTTVPRRVSPRGPGPHRVDRRPPIGGPRLAHPGRRVGRGLRPSPVRGRAAGGMDGHDALDGLARHRGG